MGDQQQEPLLAGPLKYIKYIAPSKRIYVSKYGNWNTPQRIWNPTNDYNNESKFYWQILNSLLRIWNPQSHPFPFKLKYCSGSSQPHRHTMELIPLYSQHIFLVYRGATPRVSWWDMYYCPWKYMNQWWIHRTGPPPFFLDQTEARRAAKTFLGDHPPRLI